jgi:hypothetical protein
MRMTSDEIIRLYWRDNCYTIAAKKSAAATGLTVHQVSRRAVQLGLIHSRERHRWTQSELDVVEKWSHSSLETIQRKLRALNTIGLDGRFIKRTRTAIANKMFQNRFRTNLDGMCQDHLAAALGVSAYQVAEWRKRDMLRGERRPSIDQHSGAEPDRDCLPWFYSNKHIRQFVFNYPGAFDLKKVNQAWFIDMLRPPAFRLDVDTFVKDARQEANADSAYFARLRAEIAAEKSSALSESVKPSTAAVSQTKRRKPLETPSTDGNSHAPTLSVEVRNEQFSDATG